MCSQVYLHYNESDAHSCQFLCLPLFPLQSVRIREFLLNLFLTRRRRVIINLTSPHNLPCYLAPQRSSGGPFQAPFGLLLCISRPGLLSSGCCSLADSVLQKPVQTVPENRGKTRTAAVAPEQRDGGRGRGRKCQCERRGYQVEKRGRAEFRGHQR